MRSLLTRPLVLLVALVIVAASAASAVDVPAQTTFYLRYDGCGATAAYSLSIKAPAQNDCGYIGGLPLNEAIAQAGEHITETYATDAEGVPAKLDVARNLAGEIHVHSWTGATGAGVGQVQVDGSIIGTVIPAGSTRVEDIDFGTFTGTQVATPQAQTVKFPFDLDVPDELAGATLTSLSITIETHGVFIDSGVQRAGGMSKLVLPTLVDDGTTPEPAPTP